MEKYKHKYLPEELQEKIRLLTEQKNATTDKVEKTKLIKQLNYWKNHDQRTIQRKDRYFKKEKLPKIDINIEKLKKMKEDYEKSQPTKNESTQDKQKNV